MVFSRLPVAGNMTFIIIYTHYRGKTIYKYKVKPMSTLYITEIELIGRF